MNTNPVRALLLAGTLAGALVLTACGSTSEGASSGSPSASTSAESSPSAAPSATESGKKEKKDKKSSAPAPQPTAEPSQPAERTIDFALAQDALGAYFPAFSGFATAMSSGDPGEVFTAARQFSRQCLSTVSSAGFMACMMNTSVNRLSAPLCISMTHVAGEAARR